MFEINCYEIKCICDGEHDDTHGTSSSLVQWGVGMFWLCCMLPVMKLIENFNVLLTPCLGIPSKLSVIYEMV